ncbi:MAG: flagellar hook-basal body complex protein [Planctomycetes bacterium]|nr:flagellar hook-basal body complex protein [Planctomycetota bacterium]
MSSALTVGVTGLKAHQTLLDVAGHNLANVNTTAFKASQVTFADVLGETVKSASKPSSGVGGTNPLQTGSGVAVATVSPNLTQGNTVNTNNPLDLALDGSGYFVLKDGGSDLYTRAGSFGVDSNSNLVDPATGSLVQRIGSMGEAEGFQTAGISNIKVPYGVAMAAVATSTIDVSGNLSADAVLTTPQTNVLESSLGFTTSSGETAVAGTLISALDQFSGSPAGTLAISGFNMDGTALTPGTALTVGAGTDLQDVLDHINSELSDAANDNADGTYGVATLVGGKIVITDGASGYSKSDIDIAHTAAGTETWTLPDYFEISTVGGSEIKNVNVTIYDSQGAAQVMTGAFVRTETDNNWDLILTSITGNVNSLTAAGRRIEGVSFSGSNGAFNGLSGSDAAAFTVTFAHDIANPQVITIDMGTVGKFDGLTQFAGTSTAAARDQNGYDSGSLTSVTVDTSGTVIGAFSNGVKKDLASLQIATFQNAAGLQSVSGGYFAASANSGAAVATVASTGGAGSIKSGALEKSNADVSTEFVNLIQAQNGFQASARTIKVANDILSELVNLIR